MAGEVQAWIDVGGTFTDCYVVDNAIIASSKNAEWSKQSSGTSDRRRIKVLSSGLVPLSCGGTPSQTSFIAPELEGDPLGFWVGAQLRCYDASGKAIRSAQIIGFDSASMRLELAAPILPAREQASETRASADDIAVAFEIDTGLEAPVLAVRRLLGCPLTEPLPPLSVRLGTTRGTNALLTRRGAHTALAITAPFDDLLLIGDQTRPRLFDLAVRRDTQLTESVVSISERLDAQGNILLALDRSQVRAALSRALADGAQSLAICLLHSYRNPVHELEVEAIARDIGFEHISRSSHLAPVIEVVARARTTVVDAYLSPIVRGYLKRLVDQFGGVGRVNLQVMTSAGGLVDWHEMAGKDSILSGPAGGVVALRALAAATDQPLIIGLDMGGTSTDVCRTAPDQTLEYESTKAGVRILTPTLPIETVASGGGSSCWFDGVSLRVGPQSAGAAPGPACYGRGGPLTITDLNVRLGRLPAHQFPFPLDEAAIDRRLSELHQQLSAAAIHFDSLEQLADGLRVIANQQMAEAARTVSISQGADPRRHTLVGFGGAAGQHVCEIAELLSMNHIIDSAEAGLLSALGMGLAEERRDATLPVYSSLTSVNLADLISQIHSSIAELAAAWTDDCKSATAVACVSLELRYEGSDATLSISWSIDAAVANQADLLSDRFHEEHRRRYGYARQAHGIELVAVRIESRLPTPVSLASADAVERGRCKQLTVPISGRLWSGGQWRAVPHCSRVDLSPGSILNGPAVVLSAGSTLVIADGWQAESLSDGTLSLRRTGNSELASQLADPISEAVFAQRLAAIATQMGLVLQQTALSVNVKQRRDFSCAVFDRDGLMLASAPHVPVHLGAMGATVRAAMQRFPDLSPGDVVITNDPYEGGSHLPDVTAISGVFRPGHSAPAMFVANRAHHADIGGLAPGSMSVTATKLGEEGAIIQPLRLRVAECAELLPLREMLNRATWPPRNIEENLADIRAQLAANARGSELIHDLERAFGWQDMRRLSTAVLSIAERRVRNFVRTLSASPRTFVDRLDDGTTICVSIKRVDDDRLLVDFSGTGPTSSTNYNANPSIVTATVIYVLRCLIADDLPLNEGMLAAIELRVPEGLLNPPAIRPIEMRPAVAAGNVETSQRLVDVLLGAFGAAAASQGTMNNLLFGNERFGFYETICGGAGATEGCAGASGVHTHMTNTRLTDPEVLEARYPARLVHFGLRKGSGGTGKWPGGDGVTRTIQFLEPVQVSLLTSRRGMNMPYGMAGGAPGSAGMNTRVDCQGQRHALPAACHIALEAGEAIELQTPGGGGYGKV